MAMGCWTSTVAIVMMDLDCRDITEVELKKDCLLESCYDDLG
jgi:hypothetical protein